MSELPLVSRAASELLEDIAGSYIYGEPAAGRLSFWWLEPEFSQANGVDVVERLVETFDTLPSRDPRKHLLRDAVMEAVDRCATTWLRLGVDTPLAVTQLALRIAPASLPSDLWCRMFTLTDPASTTSTERWLEGLIGIVDRCRVQPDTAEVPWLELVTNGPIRALPAVARWTLRRLRNDSDRSVPVLRQVLRRLVAERDALGKYWSDLRVVENTVNQEFLSARPEHERRRFQRAAREGLQPLSIHEDDRAQLKEDIDKALPGVAGQPDAVKDEIALAETRS